jgi:hypothetical protein
MKKGPKSGTTKKDVQPKAAQPKEKASRKTKFKVDMDPARMKSVFKEHKTVSATALALGFPKGKGNNRTHAALVKLGLVEARKGDK